MSGVITTVSSLCRTHSIAEVRQTFSLDRQEQEARARSLAVRSGSFPRFDVCADDHQDTPYFAKQGGKARWTLSEEETERSAGLWVWGLFREPLYPFLLLQMENQRIVRYFLSSAHRDCMPATSPCDLYTSSKWASLCCMPISSSSSASTGVSARADFMRRPGNAS